MKNERNILIAVATMLIASLAAAFYHHNYKGIFIPSTTTLHKATNSVYYWRTIYNPTKNEKTWMKHHDIGRMYLRMFDVVEGYQFPEPNATLQFAEKTPKGMEIVPTVFITKEALIQASQISIDMLAEKIVVRVSNMCEWNDVKWTEMQLDCDWTEGCRTSFFSLCKDVKQRLKDRKLSATIRLHQLQQTPPPVDYGVLMVYNVESFSECKDRNSILNSKTVELYLKQKMKCKLPMDIALPIFQWDLQFSEAGKFQRILYTDEKPAPCTVVRHEQVPYTEICKVQALLNKYLHLQDGNHSTILYHLDETNLKNYSNEQIKNIYNH